jgi:hypothetical protein
LTEYERDIGCIEDGKRKRNPSELASSLNEICPGVSAFVDLMRDYYHYKTFRKIETQEPFDSCVSTLMIIAILQIWLAPLMANSSKHDKRNTLGNIPG